MLTQDVSQELNQIFESLEAQGKEPTLALVKARLSTAVPMPALITAIKSWKNSKLIPKVEVALQQSAEDSRIDQLEKEVALLKSRLESLELKLK